MSDMRSVWRIDYYKHVGDKNGRVAFVTVVQEAKASQIAEADMGPNEVGFSMVRFVIRSKDDIPADLLI